MGVFAVRESVLGHFKSLLTEQALGVYVVLVLSLPIVPVFFLCKRKEREWFYSCYATFAVLPLGSISEAVYSEGT